QHVPGELGAMLIAIAETAAAAVLLVVPQHDAHGAARPEIQLLHQPHRLPGDDAAATIVGGAGADVPRIQVAADDDDLLGPLASADLADDVRRRRVGLEVRLHLQPDDDAAAAIGHALQAIGVLGADRRGGNLRRVAGVAEGAGVRRPQSARTDRAHQYRDGAVARGARRPHRSEADGLAVAGERDVEQDDAPARRRRSRIELLEAADDEHLALHAVARRADAVAEAEHHD